MWWTSNSKHGRCEAEVSDHTGYHFYQCSRSIKALVGKKGELRRVCGTHRNMMLRRGWELEAEIETQTPPARQGGESDDG